ncbi:glycoside hydrolase family 95 protein [Lactobacillus halodurans]|nr:glycoside hydrolase family 95 protein [Companilactobacillus halodurans]MQS77091.1 glycoside hydrolase family 95 protein [Companilactobacillus halodurans]
MSASAGGRNGTHFKVGCSLIADAGTVETIGETIVGRNLSSATILLTSDTNYSQKDGDLDCQKNLNKLSAVDWEFETKNHIATYQKLFNRVALQIDESKIDEIPTDKRLEQVKNGQTDLHLLQLYFDYGRYLLISSSQPGGLPANLQGIWSENTNPIWGSKFTININMQMNYWMSGPCDLSEMEEPLFDLLDNMRPNGRITAKKMYGARGFTAHHNTDGFFDTAPQSHTIGAAIWPMTVPWLCTHIFEHYLFSNDKDFLIKNYPIMKEAALFYEDYLFEYNGHLVTGPSVSPENRYRLADGTQGNVCLSPTIDNQILRYFFSCCIKSAKIVNDSSDFSQKVQEMKSKLPETKIGKHGQVQEWLEDYDEVEPGHRHISPLFGLFPGNEINQDKTPELINAAKVTIKRRLENGSYLSHESRNDAINSWTKTGFVGGKRTGWSSAWLVNFFARLHDGDKAYEELTGMLKNSTLNNLFDDHPPFQIDGNFGATNGICEMLLQSQNDYIELLPALPSAWNTGKFSGLRARDNIKFDVTWKNTKIESVEVHGEPDSNLNLVIAKEHMIDNQEFKQNILLDKSGYQAIKFN